MFPHAPQDYKVMRYTYDELNEVTREDNQILNKSITYNYDEGGNILTKAEFPYTTESLETATATKTYNYVYGDSNWKDKLTSYDGKAITYDAIGNPLTYDGYTYTWEAGRQLKVISGNGNTISYKYNDSGIRTQKTIGNVTTKYYLSGDKVTYETNGTDNMHYTYDSSDNLVSMNLNGTEYYYIRNAQSDIIGLIDGSGTQVASYTYDTWGKLISIKDQNGNDVTNDTNNVGYKNPYRYKGYRYDAETGLYYLQSRYYNLEWGRFINADAIIGQTGELLGANLFAYCQNNVVTMSDPSGFRPLYSDGEETQEMRNASYKVMSKAANPGKLPIKDQQPNSKLKTPDGKTVREYDENGRAKRDTHYVHPGHHPELKSPHYHDWKWDGDKLVGRGDPYDIVRGVCGVGVVLICAIGITVIAADDATGIGVVDDFLVAPLSSGVAKGMIMIFGG